MASRTDLRGLVGPSAGYAFVGLSVFVMLASAPRLLGQVEYSFLAVAWTLITMFGFGLAFPAEQTITSAVASGSTQRTRGVQGLIASLAAATLLVPVINTWTGGQLLGATLLWAGSVTVAACAWALNVGPRGQLAGSGRFHAYGLTQVSEGGTRLACCAGAWLLPGSAWWLAAALSVPLLVSSAVARARLASTVPARDTANAGAVPTPSARQLGPVVVVAVSLQFLLNAAPLMLQWRVPGEIAGQYVSAMTYLRIPMLLTGGFMTVTLSSAALAWARRDATALHRAVRMAFLGTAACGALTIGVWLVSGPMLRLYYGPAIDFPMTLLALMGATTVAAVAANLLTQVGIGAHRHQIMAAFWAVGALATIVVLVLAPTTELSVTLAILLGLLVCLVPVAYAVTRLRDRLSVTA